MRVVLRSEVHAGDCSRLGSRGRGVVPDDAAPDFPTVVVVHFRASTGGVNGNLGDEFAEYTK